MPSFTFYPRFTEIGAILVSRNFQTFDHFPISEPNFNPTSNSVQIKSPIIHYHFEIFDIIEQDLFLLQINSKKIEFMWLF